MPFIVDIFQKLNKLIIDITNIRLSFKQQNPINNGFTKTKKVKILI